MNILLVHLVSSVCPLVSPIATHTNSTITIILPLPSLDRNYIFSIQLNNETTSDWSRSTTFTALDLLPGTEYSFIIFTMANQSENGRGHWCASRQSGPFFFSTLEVAPSGPPLNITASSINSTSATITWSSPDTIYRGGLITGYIVEVRPGLNHILFSSFTVTNCSHFVLSALQPLTNYTIQISAVNSVGSGPFSSNVTFVTSAAPVSAIKSVTGSSADVGAIVGGIIGGALFLVAIILVIAFRLRSRSKQFSVGPDVFEPFMQANGSMINRCYFSSLKVLQISSLISLK